VARRKDRIHEKGFIRGYDARTGKRLWIFHTIPLAGEFGNNTWEKDSWSYTANAGVWAQMTVDERRTRCSCRWSSRPATTTAASSGTALFGESLVALDLKTGSASGTSSSCTTASGTWTSRARRS
jgi:quinoprotein glucose dehydrogenase